MDESLLESVSAGDSLPVLRFYSWLPACLSIGYAQSLSDVDQNALYRHGWDIVRRPTGGRAILHADEFTYSVIAPLHEPRVAGGVLESYARLAQALLRALHLLGLDAQAHPQASIASAAAGPVCFEVPSHYEITVQGKKLVGSAQLRRRDGVLQHGSLPLFGDLTRITQALYFVDEAARQRAAERLLLHAANAEMLGAKITWEDCAQAFETAFKEILHLEFKSDTLTLAEQVRAEELVKSRYAHPSWTNHIS